MNVENNVFSRNWVSYYGGKFDSVNFNEENQSCISGTEDYDGVILQLSEFAKQYKANDSKIENINELCSQDVFIENSYSVDILNARKGIQGYENKAMAMIEKYYSMVDEINTEYGSDADTYLSYLDEAFNEQTTFLGLEAGDCFTAAMVRLMSVDGAATYSKECANKIQADVMNMVGNMKEYYNEYGSFNGITGDIISKGNEFITYDDINYTPDKVNEEIGFIGKLRTLYDETNKDDADKDEIERMYGEIEGDIDSLSCSESIKDMYKYILKNYQEAFPDYSITIEYKPEEETEEKDVIDNRIYEQLEKNEGFEKSDIYKNIFEQLMINYRQKFSSYDITRLSRLYQQNK